MMTRIFFCPSDNSFGPREALDLVDGMLRFGFFRPGSTSDSEQ